MMEDATAAQRLAYKPECPQCHSTNIDVNWEVSSDGDSVARTWTATQETCRRCGHQYE